MPTTQHLLDVMVGVRNASSFVLNPHTDGCSSLRAGGCACERGRRIVAAWRAFHDALAEAGVAPLSETEGKFLVDSE